LHLDLYMWEYMMRNGLHFNLITPFDILHNLFDITVLIIFYFLFF